MDAEKAFGLGAMAGREFYHRAGDHALPDPPPEVKDFEADWKRGHDHGLIKEASQNEGQPATTTLPEDGDV